MILGSGLIQSTGSSFGTLAADSSDSALFSGYTPNVMTVGPASQRLYFGKTGEAWKTLWPDTTGALLRGDELGTYAVTKASDGPAPFDTDDGLATDTESGSVAVGTTFTHEADCLIEFIATTVQSSGNFVVQFRKQGSTNYWDLLITSARTISLREVVSGGVTTRGSAAGVVSDGARVVVIADDTSIKVYVANSLAISYANATNFKTATSGYVQILNNEAVLSNLKTWPRTLSGTAASILNKVGA